MRLLVYDATCRGRPGLPGLSHAWATGARLYRRLGWIDAAHPAASWSEALAWIATVRDGESIDEIQYWGHGRWGRALIGDDVLDVSALAPDHAHHPLLARIRTRLVPHGRALWWWRTCETFGATAGHQLATRWTRFFDCASAGHTYVIGVWQSGLHLLEPGAAPGWPADEGLREGTPDQPVQALTSRPRAPSTITCFTSRVPGRV